MVSLYKSELDGAAPRWGQPGIWQQLFLAGQGAASPTPTLHAFSSAKTASSFTAPGLTDPEAANQWHLSRLGGIADVWADYTGKGVHVGIYDSGVQYAHYDLNDNYDARRHVVVNGVTYDGDYRPASGPHGTSVAGVIAAERNGVGTVGVAYDARITGVNIFDPFSGGGIDPGIFVNGGDDRFFKAMNQAFTFDVVNHSWGSEQMSYQSVASRSVEGTFAYYQAESLRLAAAFGRGGLGTLSVIAGGNGNEDSQGDAWGTDRHAITVAAYRDSDAFASSYSSRGAHLLVSAPSSDYSFLDARGVVTTDLLGRDGYNLRADIGGKWDHTDDFGGTSSAAPVVTGVVALMLDANEGLGWRDVKNILAASSFAPRGVAAEPGGFETEFGFTIALNESRFKMAGQAAHWNGGAMHYSTDYGYGGVDARAATRMAEVWSLFGGAKTSANEQTISTPLLDVNLISSADIPRDDARVHADFVGEPVTYSFKIDQNIDLEHVDLTLRFSKFFAWGDEKYYYNPSGMQLKLIAPDGTEAFVDTIGAVGPDGVETNDFTFGFSGFRGVEAAGTWKFQFLEPFYNNSTQVTSLQLNGWGSAISADDVHTYTNEFFDMMALSGELGRAVLSDTNGGTDWINAAAVSSDVQLSLTEGAVTHFGGREAFTIAAGSRIEGAVTGDGDDRLVGNALDNKLYGMRGDDWLNGGAGNDTLFGGRGSDIFAFDTAGISGRDKVLDWSVGDRIATSKMLRGADLNGMLTLDSSGLVLLDNSTRGDTAELVGRGGAVLRALGKEDGYWWYGFVSGENVDHVDGRATELALGQTGRPDGDLPASAIAAVDQIGLVDPAMHRTAFYLYDTMGEGMASGAQIYA